jgi:hypothetical protein
MTRTAVSDLEPAKVNQAIQRGLELCRRSTAPVVSLAQYLDELRSDPAWSESSIRNVESGIRHVLARIVVETPPTDQAK